MKGNLCTAFESLNSNSVFDVGYEEAGGEKVLRKFSCKGPTTRLQTARFRAEARMTHRSPRAGGRSSGLRSD